MDVDSVDGEPVVLVERICRGADDLTHGQVEDNIHVSVSRGNSFKRDRPGPRTSKRDRERGSEDKDSRSYASHTHIPGTDDEDGTDWDVSSIASGAQSSLKKERGDAHRQLGSTSVGHKPPKR